MTDDISQKCYSIVMTVLMKFSCQALYATRACRFVSLSTRITTVLLAVSVVTAKPVVGRLRWPFSPKASPQPVMGQPPDATLMQLKQLSTDLTGDPMSAYGQPDCRRRLQGISRVWD